MDGIARQDRWTIARRWTGRLLEQLLPHSGDRVFAVPSESSCLGAAVDNDFPRAIQQSRFTETIDADIIARHSPLDTRAAAIDWDDPTAVLHTSSNGTTTVADALTELAEWDQRAWTWIADECAMFGGLYLRARHPELVRRY